MQKMKFGAVFPLVLAFIQPLVAEDREIGPDALLRSGQWREVIQYFENRRPSTAYEHLMVARSFSELPPGKRGSFSENGSVALKYYLLAAGFRCEDTTTQSAVMRCLASVRTESETQTASRYALLKASALAKREGGRELELRLLEIPSLSTGDPVARKTLIDRLSVLLDWNRVEGAAEVARRGAVIPGAQAALARAKVAFRAGKRTESLDAYLSALEQTEEEWVRASIVKDLRTRHPEAFTAGYLLGLSPGSRILLLASGQLQKGEIDLLSRTYPLPVLLENARPVNTGQYGMFLIRAGRASDLEALAARNYTHLSRDPDDLYSWVSNLVQKREYNTALKLISQFPHAKKQNPGLWILLLDILERRAQDHTYFSEMLDYVNVYHADSMVYDRLLEFLLGRKVGKITWAPEIFWQEAETRLPRQTGAGRVVYWMYRHALAGNNPRHAAEILRTFYERAPGSYYARAFWDTSPSADFRSDWRSVHNRPTYLAWIARHGGREDAVHFLASKDVYRYLDPAAVDLYRKIKDYSLDLPSPILELYRIGDYPLAEEYYRAAFEGGLSKRENLMRMAYIGRQTRNLYLSVWFTRQVSRDAGVPEDPFSMPPGLLRELYPRPYRNIVKRYASEHRIEEEMVYALMRQESMFKELAVSRSGAMGLMQIMPGTATYLARPMKILNPNPLIPEVSIAMGSKFFADMLRGFNSDFRWAAIAYNGGPGNLTKWKREYYSGDFNLFLENLPIQEPRHYCRVTYQNYMHYRSTNILYP